MRKRKYRGDSFATLVSAEMLMNDACCIDSIPESVINHCDVMSKKIECDLYIKSMSPEAQTFFNMVLNSPTEFLDALFGAKKNNMPKYNNAKIYSWLRKRYEIKKVHHILNELKNLYEYIA